MTELPAWLATAGAIAAAIGTIGGLAGLAALLKARAEKKKLTAEADKTHAEADKVDADAAAQLTTVALQLVEPLRDEMGNLRARVGQLETDARVQHMLLVEHSVWDHLALARMKAEGVDDLPPIPPLFPARTEPAHAPAGATTVTVEVGQPAT